MAIFIGWLLPYSNKIITERSVVVGWNILIFFLLSIVFMLYIIISCFYYCFHALCIMMETKRMKHLHWFQGRISREESGEDRTVGKGAEWKKSKERGGSTCSQGTQGETDRRGAPTLWLQGQSQRRKVQGDVGTKGERGHEAQEGSQEAAKGRAVGGQASQGCSQGRFRGRRGEGHVKATDTRRFGVVQGHICTEKQIYGSNKNYCVLYQIFAFFRAIRVIKCLPNSKYLYYISFANTKTLHSGFL